MAQPPGSYSKSRSIAIHHTPSSPGTMASVHEATSIVMAGDATSNPPDPLVHPVQIKTLCQTRRSLLQDPPCFVQGHRALMVSPLRPAQISRSQSPRSVIVMESPLGRVQQRPRKRQLSSRECRRNHLVIVRQAIRCAKIPGYRGVTRRMRRGGVNIFASTRR